MRDPFLFSLKGKQEIATGETRWIGPNYAATLKGSNKPPGCSTLRGRDHCSGQIPGFRPIGLHPGLLTLSLSGNTKAKPICLYFPDRISRLYSQSKIPPMLILVSRTANGKLSAVSLFLESDQPEVSERACVSVLKRVVPAVSFGVASLSGIAGAIMTIKAFIELKNAENAGMDSIAESLASINFVTLGLLGLSIAIGVAGIVYVLVRTSSDRTKSSPPGFLYLVAGLPNLISPTLVAYAWSVVVDVVLGRNTNNPTGTGAWISQILLIAIPAGIAALMILPVFAFVPFRARNGRKVTSIAALTAMVIAIAAIAIHFIGLADTLMSDPRVTYDGR